ncbi:ABC transporter permease [Citricoccus sp. NPDC079358]|uniref:ABC transporter permease n=1 Tax=Citricoccus sp. NPDC079358 TaxID=3154653 RepID=UPI00344E7117
MNSETLRTHTTLTAGGRAPDAPPPARRPLPSRQSRQFRPSRGAHDATPGRAVRILCATVLAALVAYAVLVPILFTVDPFLVDYRTGAQGPSPAHPFGTDVAGRDLFSRSAAGLRVSLIAAIAGAAGAVVIGTAAGATCAMVGGRFDRWCMRGVDTLNAVPHLLLGIVVASFFRGSLLAIVMVVAVTHWTQTARLVRSEILTLRAQDHVRAAVSQGFTRLQLVRHLGLPLLGGQLAVAAGLLVPHAVWHESTLTFIGLGLPPHQPSLGSLLQLGQEALLSGAWWSIAVPAGLLVLVTVCLAGLLRSPAGRS